MATDAPTLSICIATRDRAAFLHDCLGQLHALPRIGFTTEVVVSDDASTDETEGLLETWRGQMPALRVYRSAESVGERANLTNALRMARGDFVVCLGDGDQLVLLALGVHVARLIEEPELAAIYTDWITWDEEQGRELHRHLGLQEAVSFGPDTPLALVNFVIDRNLAPEIAIYRRKALLAAWLFPERSLHIHPALYALSRQGRVRFDPLPFYKEVRVPRAGLQRLSPGWTPDVHPLQFIGDEMRLGMESMLAQGLMDAGVNGLPADQVEKARNAIDAVLHRRTRLEIERARSKGDFILAVELKRRLNLWRGAGTLAEQQDDVSGLILPAAFQMVARTYHSLSEAQGISVRGFKTPSLASFLSQWAPDIPVVVDDTIDSANLLIVHHDRQTQAADPDPNAAEALVFEQLVALQRLWFERVDISDV